MPWKIYKDGQRWCIHKLNADGSRGERVACHETEEAAEAQRRALEANVNELALSGAEGFRGQFSDVLAVTELRGSYPTVPIAPDVDYQALIAGDDDPMFLTIPIGKAGVTSGNQRHYDDAFVVELERQTLANKPIGLMGHLSEAERATAFPPEAVHWVGALREGDTLWGKGYIPPGPVRDRIRRYKAQGKAIATSIDAFAEGIFDKALNAYRMVAETLRLNQIDIAPADRAGIPALAAVPLLTTEMQEAEPTPETEQEPEMGKEELLNELRRTRVPAHQGWQPHQAADAPLETAIRETLGLSEDADIVQTITEMRQAQEAQEKQAVQARIVELAAHPETGIRLEAVRGLVVELVQARNPATVEEAEAAYRQVVESEAVKAALKSHVQETMGPRQGSGSLAGQNGRQRKYFVIPEGQEG